MNENDEVIPIRYSKQVNQGSIEIEKNSKGYNYSVKAYGDTVKEISDNLNELISAAESIIKTRGEMI